MAVELDCTPGRAPGLNKGMEVQQAREAWHVTDARAMWTEWEEEGWKHRLGTEHTVHSKSGQGLVSVNTERGMAVFSWEET